MTNREALHENIIRSQEAGKFLLDIVQADFDVEQASERLL